MQNNNLTVIGVQNNKTSPVMCQMWPLGNRGHSRGHWLVAWQERRGSYWLKPLSSDWLITHPRGVPDPHRPASFALVRRGGGGGCAVVDVAIKMLLFWLTIVYGSSYHVKRRIRRKLRLQRWRETLTLESEATFVRCIRNEWGNAGCFLFFIFYSLFCFCAYPTYFCSHFM